MANYSDIFPLSTGGSSIAGFNWTEKTADFTAVANEAYYCDTALGNILMTLPSNPNPGDEVAFLLIGANAVKITTTDNIKSAPLATDYLKQVTENYLMFVWSYVDGTVGWSWDARYDSFINNTYIGAGDPYFNNVVLLLKGDGANGSTNIVDSSLTPKTISVFGNTQISTAQSKYGGSSIYFDGAGDYLQTADNSDYAFGTGDFTIEFWLYKQRSTQANIIDFRPAGQNGDFPLIYSIGNNIYYHSDSAIWITGTLPGDNQWIHVALSRNNGESRLFINGIQSEITFADTLNYTSSNKPTIGSSSNTNQWFLQGYIDSLRITKITGRYTINFNPETDTFLNV